MKVRRTSPPIDKTLKLLSSDNHISGQLDDMCEGFKIMVEKYVNRESKCPHCKQLLLPADYGNSDSESPRRRRKFFININGQEEHMPYGVICMWCDFSYCFLGKNFIELRVGRF